MNRTNFYDQRRTIKSSSDNPNWRRKTDDWRLVCCYSALNFANPRTTVLVELRLENYAVIDNLVVEFASGLNLLTGETGAGKSILIDALTLLLGEKASSEVIRTGTDRAVISAVFEIESSAGKTIA